MSRRAICLAAAAALSVAIVALLDPVAQDPRYHDFADGRTRLGIPCAANVLSNLPFVVVGWIGLWRARRAASGRLPLAVFSASVLLTGFGSGWYHLQPGSARLVWDRLPLGVSCLALLDVLIDRRLGARPARLLLAPLVLFGLGSVLWWAWGESAGHGDLRAYGLAQFFPALGIVVLLWPPARGDADAAAVWRALACYAAAKLAEHFDTGIFALGHVVSGHTLKHLLAATAAACLLPLARPAPDPQVSRRSP